MKPSTFDPFPFSFGGPTLNRRHLLAGAGAGALAALTPRRAGAVLSIDINQGNIQPMPIALPDFVAGTPAEAETARNVTAVITNDLQRSGLFAPIDPQAYIEKITNTDAVPRFADWRIINAQALATGRLTASGRRPAESRIPPVGCVRRPAARRQAILHLARQLAAHRPHHRRRDLPDAHRREGLFRQPHRVRRRDRAEATSASSGWRSWTRTASACAISRAATSWC